MDIAVAELVDPAVTPETEPRFGLSEPEPAEIDAVLDLDEGDGEGPPEQEPEASDPSRSTQRRLRRRSQQRILYQQAELNKLRETNRRLAAELSRAHRTIDTLIDGHKAAIAQLRAQVEALGQ